MSEIIRRVGQAIAAELVRQELAGEDFDEAESNDAIGKAAIWAMREPTEPMIDPGREVVFKDRMRSNGGRTKAGVAIDVYQAMIDEAMK